MKAKFWERGYRDSQNKDAIAKINKSRSELLQGQA